MKKYILFWLLGVPIPILELVGRWGDTYPFLLP